MQIINVNVSQAYSYTLERLYLCTELSQKPIGLSSSEAEYMPLYETLRAIRWLSQASEASSLPQNWIDVKYNNGCTVERL